MIDRHVVALLQRDAHGEQAWFGIDDHDTRVCHSTCPLAPAPLQIRLVQGVNLIGSIR
jgi:hypothetical protein